MNNSNFRMFKQEKKSKPDDEANEPAESPAQERAEMEQKPGQDSKKRTMFKVGKKKAKY